MGYILVTDWIEVDKDDFYLTRDLFQNEVYIYPWIENASKENMKQARKLQKSGELYYGYIVDATNYAVFQQMDSEQVLIDSDANVIIICENAIIGNNHTHREKYEKYDM